MLRVMVNDQPVEIYHVEDLKILCTSGVTHGNGEARFEICHVSDPATFATSMI